LNWLITGGCGFIGTSLIKNLVSEGGHYVRVLDDLSVGTREDLAAVSDFTEIKVADLKQPGGQSYPVELIVDDIIDSKICFGAAQNVDIIVHLAANTGVVPSVKDPKKDMEVNVVGTLNMLEAARHNQIKSFVFASSGAPIGECALPIHEEIVPHPVSPYGASKLAGEGYCSAYYRTFGLETVTLRFSNVYGPGSMHKDSVVAKFIRQALKGEILQVYGDGKQTRDFIFIDDLTNAIRLAVLNKGIGGEIFQIATNTETTVSELTDKLVGALNSMGIGPVNIFHAQPRRGDVRRNLSDTTKAQKSLNWKAEVGLEQGLKQTVDWFFSCRFQHENQ